MSRARVEGHLHFQNYPDTAGQYPLIGPGDPPPYVTYNDHGKAPVLLVADHASPLFPAGMNQLGLADWVLERHVVWDIGVDKLTQFLADELDAQAVLPGSDYNRTTVNLGFTQKLNKFTVSSSLSE